VTLLARLRGTSPDRLERLIGLAGLACALVVIAATVAHALQLRDALFASAQDRLKTIARVLSKEANRSLAQPRGLLDPVDELLRDPRARPSDELQSLLVYWPKARSDLAGCRAALEAGNPAARKAAARSLKGASSSLGSDSVAERAGLLEHCDEALASRALDDLEAAFAAVQAAWSVDPTVTAPG